MGSKILPVLIAMTLSAPAFSAEPAHLKTPEQRFSYSIGYQVGQSLKRDGIKVDRKAFTQAVHDVLDNSKPKLTAAEMQAALDAYRQQRVQAQLALAAKNAKAGKAFLDANKKKKGVVQLPSGLQYKIIKPGTGPRPKPTDSVVVNYRGALIGGKEFDSSYRRGTPATFPIHSVIQGWQQILPLMKEGAKWKVFVPAKLAYGAHGAGNVIGPNATLIFDIELISIKEGTQSAPHGQPGSSKK